MNQVELIATRYIFSLLIKGVEYHVTTSDDLKEVYEIDPEYEDTSEIKDILWKAIMNDEIKNFN